MINRRKFIAAIAAGAIITAEGLWIPGQKLISIPKKPMFSRYFGMNWQEHPRFFVGDPVTIRNKTYVRAGEGDTIIGVVTHANPFGKSAVMNVQFPFIAEGPLTI